MAQTPWMKELMDNAEKRPLMLVLLASAIVWLATAYRDETAAHLNDVKALNLQLQDVQRESITAHQKLLELTETLHYLQRRTPDTLE